MIPRCASFSSAKASPSRPANASFIRSRAGTGTDVAKSELDWLPWLLQTSDALFPTGAYAHSLGFEESVRLGVVRDAATLRAFLLEQIVPALREQELPYLRFACSVADDLAALAQLDHEISAWKLASEAREASAQLGTRRLKA